MFGFRWKGVFMCPRKSAGVHLAGGSNIGEMPTLKEAARGEESRRKKFFTNEAIMCMKTKGTKTKSHAKCRFFELVFGQVDITLQRFAGISG